MHWKYQHGDALIAHQNLHQYILGLGTLTKNLFHMLSALCIIWKTGSAYYSNLWVWKRVWFSKVGVVMKKIRARFARTDFPQTTFSR